MNRRWRLAILPLIAGLLCLGGLHRARAQTEADPDVTVTIDRTRVTVGDPIVLSVVVRHVQGTTVDTTSLDDQLGTFEPLGSDPPEEHLSGGLLELRLRYRVAIYHTGQATIPQFVIAYTAQDGTRQQVTSKAPIDVTVQSILPADANPTDIKGLKSQFALPAPASARWALVGGIAGSLAIVALAVLGGMFLWRRRAQAIAVLEGLPASASARAELDRIMALDLYGGGQLGEKDGYVEHYRLLAACIRRYLTDRFGFLAVAQTTGELERQMEARGVGRWPARLVGGLLNECDAVTYARYRPAAARVEADNAMAYEILDAMEQPTAQGERSAAVAAGRGG